MQHLTEYLDWLIIDILEETLDACLDYALLYLILYKQFHEDTHVAEQLQPLPVLDLLMIYQQECLLVEVLTELASLHALSATLPLLLLSRLQLLELLLTLVEQEFLEVHLDVVLVVVLAEEEDAEADVELEVSALGRGLHEDDLHELVQERRGEEVVVQDVLSHVLKVVF